MPLVGQAKYIESGIASIYSVRTNGGTVTASGKPLRDSELTAAHKTLPFGSRVRVTCSKTKRSVVVRITDRGPYVKGRVIDLTPKAAQAIGLDWKRGITKVTLHRETPSTNKLENKPVITSKKLPIVDNVKPPMIEKPSALKVKPADGAPFIDTKVEEQKETMDKNNNYKWVITTLVLVYVIYKVKKWLTNRKNVIQ